MPPYCTPGLYKEEVFTLSKAQLVTGVPVFIGLTSDSPGVLPDDLEAFVLNRWQEFTTRFGEPVLDSHLFDAVKGFFENGGRFCYVVGLGLQVDTEALEHALALLQYFDDADLICAPDFLSSYSPSELPPLDQFEEIWNLYVRRQLDRTGRSPNPEQVIVLQRQLLDFCDRDGGYFTILDGLPNANVSEIITQRQSLHQRSGALYYPWLQVEDGLVPPSGHVAGVYARTDEVFGVHKAPANEGLKGVVDVETRISNIEQDQLNPEAVNCIRVFPGRGIRVWGARTLGSQTNTVVYVNIRRLLITVGRWAEKNLITDVFEPNSAGLWAKIRRRLGTYLNSLFQAGSFNGTSRQEAFYIKCDHQNNPAEVRDAGMLIVEVGIRPADPSEFILLKLIRTENGIRFNTTLG